MSMVDRAARAMWEAFPERVHSPWDKRHEYMKDETRKEVRAALLAALDPEDEALETLLASAMAPEIFEALGSTGSLSEAYRLSHDAREFRGYARAAIAALRASIGSADGSGSTDG